MELLKEYADNQANLSSEALREQLTEDIMKIMGNDPRDINYNE